METLVDKFHKHLDRCAQCRENPFNLCPKGAIILSAAVSAGMISAQQSFAADGANAPRQQSQNSTMSVGPAGFMAGPRRR